MEKIEWWPRWLRWGLVSAVVGLIIALVLIRGGGFAALPFVSAILLFEFCLGAFLGWKIKSAGLGRVLWVVVNLLVAILFGLFVFFILVMPD
jgi:hypothetical protein